MNGNSEYKRKRSREKVSSSPSSPLSQRRSIINTNQNANVHILESPTKSVNDKKDYRMIKLRNGMTVLLISEANSITSEERVNIFKSTTQIMFDECEGNSNDGDSDVDVNDEDDSDDDSVCDSNNDSIDMEVINGNDKEKLAACALCVDVGSFSDPADCQGLAHLVEHMIFMGSRKYPLTNELDRYLSRHGGSDNGQTNYEETVFYFDVSLKYFLGALDRFSSLLRDPLMLKSAIEAEREIVESEFKGVLMSDSERRESFYVSLANPDFPHSKFAWGNLKSLKDNITDDELYTKIHEFRSKHYSAHHMKLVVQAKLPLDDLQSIVDHYFSTITSNNEPPPGDDFQLLQQLNPFTNEFYDKYYLIPPIKNKSIICLTWCLPPMYSSYKSKPTNYIAHLVEHEGKGGLCSYLKQKMLAMDVICGTTLIPSSDSNSLFSLFTIDVILTKIGVTAITKVISTITSYLKFLQQVGPKKEIFTEMQSIKNYCFRFAQESSSIDNVEDLVTNLKYYPPKDIMTGPYLLFEYNPIEITNVLDTLNELRFNLVVQTKEDPYKQIDYDNTEKWFGTEYTTKDYDRTMVEMWKNICPLPEFHIPELNKFIPTDFEIYKIIKNDGNPYECPKLIIDNALCELWYRPDDTFLLPKAIIYINLYSINTLASAENCVMTDLFVRCLDDIVAEELYPSFKAGISYSVCPTSTGLFFQVEGYNHKIHMVFDPYLNAMKDIAQKINPEKFQVLFEDIKNKYFNILIKASKFACIIYHKVLGAISWSIMEMYEAITKINYECFIEFCAQFIKSFKLIGLIQGNMLKEQAKDILDNMIRKLTPTPIENITDYDVKFRKIEIGTKILNFQNYNQYDSNTFTYNVYQMGTANERNTCLLSLMTQCMEEPLFDVLRTKEGLAYDVSLAMDWNARRYHVLAYTIHLISQSNNNTAEFVDERIENFRSSMLDYFKCMPNKEFQDNVETLIKLNEQADIALDKECQRNWDEIQKKEFNFDRREQDIKIYQSLTKSEFMEFCENHFNSNNLQKIAIQIIGSDKNVMDTTQKKNFNINDLLTEIPANNNINSVLNQFHSGLEIYPSVRKQIDVIFKSEL